VVFECRGYVAFVEQPERLRRNRERLAAKERVTSDLRLSPADQHNVQAAIRAILVCAPYQSLTDWRLEVHRAVKRVVDGDMATSYLGTLEREAVLSEEIGRISEFVPLVSSLANRFSIWDRTMELGVWDRSTLWQAHIGDFLRSSYYHEFVRPIRAFDGVGLAVRVGNMHAGLQVHRDSKRGVRFGRREVALLQLLHPAFHVGLEIATSYFAAAGQLEKLKASVHRIPASSASSGIMHSSLTHRELEVVRLLAARRSNYEIAELLHVSRATAKRHTENILLKLGVHSRREVERIIDGL
jgi:DNA-binding CsgD family transcriptional regulator